MKLLTLAVLFCAFSVSLFSQTFNVGDSVAISFIRLDKPADNERQPTLVVIFKNVRTKPIYSYSRLIEGDYDDRFSNFYLNLEQKKGTKYRFLSTGYFKNSHEMDFSDSMRYYDLHKHLLGSSQSDSLPVRIFDSCLLWSLAAIG